MDPTHWNDALALDRGAAMAMRELEVLATCQFQEAMRGRSQAMQGLNLLDGSEGNAYTAFLADVAQRRVREGIAKARAAASNFDMLRGVAFGALGPVPPPDGVCRVECANTTLIGELERADAWLASFIRDIEARS